MKTSWLFLVMLGIMGTGCAFTPQAVVLRPDMQVTPSSVGQGRSVLLTVVDERPRSILGRRGVQGVGAELTVQGDLPTIVRETLSNGLQRQGFSPSPEKPVDGRELRVEIRNLDYSVAMGFWAGTLRTESGLKAICILGTSRPYERLYRGEVEETVMVVQGAEANEAYLNSALSKALNQLLGDSRLSQCLAQQAQP